MVNKALLFLLLSTVCIGQTIHLRPTPSVIDVKDPQYGAVGDGSTDDLAAFNKAITAAQLTGEDIYIPGVNSQHANNLYYRLSDTWSITAEGVHIFGDGISSLLVISAADGSPAIQVTSTNRVRIPYRTCALAQAPCHNHNGQRPSSLPAWPDLPAS